MRLMRYPLRHSGTTLQERVLAVDELALLAALVSPVVHIVLDAHRAWTHWKSYLVSIACYLIDISVKRWR